MKRDTQKEIDIVEIIFGLLTAFASSAPLNAYTLVRGWPTSEVLAGMTKGLIYLEAPTRSDFMTGQGSSKGLNSFSMVIGSFATASVGGFQTALLAASYMLDLFNDPYTIEAKQFNVTLDAVYTNTTLSTQGLDIVSADGPRNAYTEEPDQWRVEITLEMIA